MRRIPLSVVVALAIFTAMVAAAHLYFAQRLVHDTALPHPWAVIAACVIAAGGALIFIHPLVERGFGPALGRVFAWPAYLWLGTCFYLLLGLWVSDLVLLLSGQTGLDVARARAAALCAVVLVAVGAGMRSALRPAGLKRVELEIESWPAALDGYRIVQISDIHVGSLLQRAFTERLVRRCNELAPDLIAITGDLVDGSVRHLAEHVAPFAALRGRDGVYFVTGNHDYFSGADPWVGKLTELGIQVLRNRRVAIERNGARVELAGVDDLSSRRRSAEGRSGHDLKAALDGWDGSTPLVLLAHHPHTFEQAHPRGVHLQLSGHTHGGQLWPFGWFVRLQTRYVAGLYRRGRSLLYVSRGTGFWGPPMRVLAPSEITEIVLRGAATAKI